MPVTPETLARRLVRAVYDATDGQPMHWRSPLDLSTAAATDAAVQLAVDRGWLLCEGGHSVCLTEEGRKLAQG